jgi:hypothetical protein
MIDVPHVNCQILNPPCNMPLDKANTELAMATSQPQPQPPLLEVPIPTMPTTTTVVVPLKLSEAQQSTEIINSPYTVLDIQGNDTGHLRSSTASISKKGKKVAVANITTLDLNSSLSLRYNMSLPTSDTWLSCRLS